MSEDLRFMLEAFRLGHEDRAKRILREYMEKKIHGLIFEDHENVMSAKEMEKHIVMLHGKAKDKAEFLKKLASYSDLDACSEQDFRKCAENILSKGKDELDEAIHALEKLVGYVFKPEQVDEDFGNVITRPVDGAAVGQPKIANAYTTRKISKKKKVLPRVKKGPYGTGYAPGGWHGDHDSDHGNTGGGSDAGGGDGGGGGE